MKVYTKTGDKGSTSLVGGARVKKNDARIEAYGTVDELLAFVGLLRDSLKDTVVIKQLIQIQNDLMVCASHLAAENKFVLQKMPELGEEQIKFLEKAIDAMDEVLPPLSSFVLPGGSVTLSYCHVCRTICRRAERRIFSISEQENVTEILLKYVNRLSDYLFVLSRKLSHDLRVEEIQWKPQLHKKD